MVWHVARPRGHHQDLENVDRFWHGDAFEPEDIIVGEDKAAVFERFTYTSTKLKKTITFPFAILLKITEGKISHMQFMEDTFCTSSSFRSGDSWQFESDPEGGVVTI